jgi:hypothetical protein
MRWRVAERPRGDGASKDILRWITHAPEGDVVDDYTTLVWQPLCQVNSGAQTGQMLQEAYHSAVGRRDDDKRHQVGAIRDVSSSPPEIEAR